jgi:hypothetical protein
VAVAATLLGVAVVGYGLLLVQQSTLGGAHVAAIGLSLALSGLFATGWARRRFDLSETTRRRLVVGLAVLSAALLVLFVVVNFAFFEGGEFESSG